MTSATQGGETRVRSANSGSFEDAGKAAPTDRGASRARLQQSSDNPPPADLAGRRNPTTATLRDRLDAERWLDEGGSFSSEAVTR